MYEPKCLLVNIYLIGSPNSGNVKMTCLRMCLEYLPNEDVIYDFVLNAYFESEGEIFVGNLMRTMFYLNTFIVDEV
jgi:hypothetical protein